MKGKVPAALCVRLVLDQGSAGVLDLEDEIDGKQVSSILTENTPQFRQPTPALSYQALITQLRHTQSFLKGLMET